MLKTKDIKFGDIVTYKSGRINNVNDPRNYNKYYNESFENIRKGEEFDIVKIQRFKKILMLYILKTIYRRY